MKRSLWEKLEGRTPVNKMTRNVAQGKGLPEIPKAANTLSGIRHENILLKQQLVLLEAELLNSYDVQQKLVAMALDFLKEIKKSKPDVVMQSNFGG